MRILFLSQRFLLPMDTGGKIRTGNILKHLSKDHDITLISNVEAPKDDPYLVQMDAFCSKLIPIPWKEVKKHSPLFFARLAVQMFSIYPVNVLNDYSKSLKQAVAEEYMQGAYDIAVCDFVQSALMFRKLLGIPTILFQHNVESMIGKRHVKQSGNIIAKLFWWLQWKKMLYFEKKACEAFTAVIAVSKQDKDEFQRLYGVDNVAAIPTGVDVDYFSPMPDVQVQKNSLVFCGSMDWLPNEDAMMFFLEKILPIVKKEIPDITLTIVGRNPSPALQELVSNYPEAELTGWVEDTRPYIAASALAVVPIRIGGGTRMKIYEAMAMGKAVVSTLVGAEGLPVINDENIVLVDNAEMFGKKLIELLKDSHTMNEIAQTALTFVRKNFAWQYVAEEFLKICSVHQN